MNIFPKSISQNANIENLREKQEKTRVKDLFYDIKSKKVLVRDGKTEFTTLKEQIKQWVYLLIHTEFGKYKVYDNTDFGIRFLYEMRGHEFYSSGFTIAMIKSELEQKILLNKNITAVENIEITKGFNTLEFEFTLKTIDDYIEMGVSIDV